MRSRLLRWVSCAAFASALALLPDNAAAQTAVLFSPPDSSELRELRVAVASTPQTAVWFSLKTFGGSDDIFMVVPAPSGAALDTSTDAWFEALAAATNTRVLPPAASPSCAPKPAPGALQTIGTDAHAATQSQEDKPQTFSFAGLVLWAKNQGWTLSAEQLARLADLETSGHVFVVVRFAPPAGETLSRTLRITPATAQSSVPLLLTRAGSTRVPATVWHLAPGRAWPKTLAALPFDKSKLRWDAYASQPQSNYAQVWESALAAVDGQGWLIDAASHDILFLSTPLVSGAAAIPSVGATYFERAAAYGDAGEDWGLCTTRFASMQNSTLRFSAACGRGEVSWVGADAGAACVETVQPGGLDPQELRCGPRADDLAIAFSGSRPSDMWLTRWTGWIPAWTTRASESFEVKPGPVVQPFVKSAAYEKDCGGDGGTDGGKPADPGGQGGSGGSGSYPPGGGSYGGANGSPQDPGSGDDEDCEDCGGNVVVDPSVAVDASCSGDSSSSSSGDSCSGDSSEGGGDSCDGDSSESGGDSCDGDSSQSGGDSCDGDSSQSGGDSCDGDTSSGGGESCDGGGTSGGGDSCSGGGSTGGSDCSVAKGRGRRAPPLSGMTLALTALLLPLRRWRKR